VFGQTYQSRDLLIVLVLILLEGVLSIDNALVLGLLARRVPKPLQRKALTWGLAGAFIFRFISIALASKLLEWKIVKLLGGGYLVFVAVKHIFFEKAHEPSNAAATTADNESTSATDKRAFWSALIAIELTDIAFAVDSIIAAIALVGPVPPGTPAGSFHPKLWVVVTGGVLGLILMRFAAVVFIKLLEKFPRFELSAYLLVLVIGLKLVADWWFNAESMTLDFHDPGSIAFWVFWLLMLACFATGFMPARQAAQKHQPEAR
jgi:YkoY family integral membrane protein